MFFPLPRWLSPTQLAGMGKSVGVALPPKTPPHWPACIPLWISQHRQLLFSRGGACTSPGRVAVANSAVQLLLQVAANLLRQGEAFGRTLPLQLGRQLGERKESVSSAPAAAPNGHPPQAKTKPCVGLVYRFSPIQSALQKERRPRRAVAGGKAVPSIQEAVFRPKNPPAAAPGAARRQPWRSQKPLQRAATHPGLLLFDELQDRLLPREQLFLAPFLGLLELWERRDD